MTPKNPYLQKFQSGASMDEKTLAEGKGMPQSQLVSIDNKFNSTFALDCNFLNMSYKIPADVVVDASFLISKGICIFFN